VKGLAPLACKTDRIDAWVLAELARRDLVPAIWLPDPRVRAERERARWRLHHVRHRSSLEQRAHAVLLTHGKPRAVSDLFGVGGGSCSPDSGCPSRGRARSKQACVRSTSSTARSATASASCAGSAPTTATCRCC
jgi:hypothetical protein